jgi:hypothetical protein
MTRIHRIAADFRARRHLDVYVVAGTSIVFAVLSAMSDQLSDNLRWATLLAGLTVLMLRSVSPPVSGMSASLLGDRSELPRADIVRRLGAATEVWIFGPSAAHILSGEVCDALRQHVLGRAGGSVRVAVLDPTEWFAVESAERQLTGGVDYPTQRFRVSLASTVGKLGSMAGWNVPGSFDYRYLPFNPGFSMIVVDPYGPRGFLIVELHGVYNAATSSRMHIRLSRGHQRRWFTYWVHQFESLWELASEHDAAPAG